MGLVSNVTYPARDGVKIPAYLTLPLSVTSSADIKNLPFVILPHGGPYARKAKRFDYFAQFFATRGFAVLQMNFRGSAGYGKGFEDAGRENWVKMQDDVEDGTKWIVEERLRRSGPNLYCRLVLWWLRSPYRRDQVSGTLCLCDIDGWRY